jgi:superfamily II DNA/RNA helicase
MLKGVNTIVKSGNGTGKKTAFVITTLNQLDENIDNLQIIVLTTTMEASQAIAHRYQLFGKYMNINASVLRSVSYGKQNPTYLDGNQIVIGSPNQVGENIYRKIIKLHNVKVVIIDESDFLFERYNYDIEYVLASKPADCKVHMFTAGGDNDITARLFKHIENSDPILINHIEKHSYSYTLKNVSQYYVLLEKDFLRVDRLVSLLSELNSEDITVFCNNKDIDYVYTCLGSKYPVTKLHSDMPQTEQIEIRRAFNGRQLGILVVSGDSGYLLRRRSRFVINYDLPVQRDDYVDRGGRDRFGNRVIINLVTAEGLMHLKEIVNYYNTDIEELPNDISKLNIQ